MPREGRRKIKRCAFCARPFVGDGRHFYCTKACRQGLVRADPQRFRFAGFVSPAEGLTELSVSHAVTSANDGGGRSAAYGRYGRFVPLSGSWEGRSNDSDVSCRNCHVAMSAWPPPATLKDTQDG